MTLTFKGAPLSGKYGPNFRALFEHAFNTKNYGSPIVRINIRNSLSFIVESKVRAGGPCLMLQSVILEDPWIATR